MNALLERLRESVHWLVTNTSNVPTKHIQVMDDAHDEIVRLRRIESALNELEAEAERHRVEYNQRTHPGFKAAVFAVDDTNSPMVYWQGRRDEAGHFRDRLAAALTDLEPK